jgi:hypothetical protein
MWASFRCNVGIASNQGGHMSTKEKEQGKDVETCTTGSCSTEKSKEQAQKQAEKKEVNQLDQPVKKNQGSCCG